MQVTRNIMPEEVRKAKLLLGKGLNVTEVANIIGRSVSAVIRIRDGAYDFLLAECQESPQDDGRMDILLKSIDSRLYRQNEDMKKAIAQLEGLNAAFVDLQNEIKMCTACMTAMLDALNDIKSQNRPQAVPDAPPCEQVPRKGFCGVG